MSSQLDTWQAFGFGAQPCLRPRNVRFPGFLALVGGPHHREAWLWGGWINPGSAGWQSSGNASLRSEFGPETGGGSLEEGEPMGGPAQLAFLLMD